MEPINIVLLEPEIPQNTGNIARTCASTGAILHLIEPLGFKIDNAKLKRAGLDYWHYLDIRYYANLADFYKKNPGAHPYMFSKKATHSYCDISYPERVYLMFGKESQGLPEELLEGDPEHSVRIPMVDGPRSLNLSNAVAVAVYEVLRQRGFEGLKQSGK